jgi:hypothetical protein
LIQPPKTSGGAILASGHSFRVVYSDPVVEKRIASQRFLQQFKRENGSTLVIQIGLLALVFGSRVARGHFGFIEGLLAGSLLAVLWQVADGYISAIRKSVAESKLQPPPFAEISVDADQIDIATDESRLISPWSNLVRRIEGDGYILLIMRGAWIPIPTAGVDSHALQFIRDKTA